MLRLRIICFAFVLLGTTVPVAAEELLISAAVSLSNAFKEIGAGFERSRPGARATFNFAASDVLLKQIVEGAPVDVFASADQEAMDRADKEKIIDPATRRNFAANRLVLAVARDWSLPLSSLEDLKAGALKRIAISQPATVPAGRYAKSALERSKLWDALAGKFIYTQNVRQNLDYLARGEVDAAFVYSTDVAIMGDKVRIAFAVATPLPVLYPIAVVRMTKNAELACAFVAWVNAAASQKILQNYGFAPP